MKNSKVEAQHDEFHTRLQNQLGRMALDTGAVMTFNWDVISDALSLGSTGCAFFGVSPDEIEMAGFMANVDREDVGHLENNLNRIMAGETETVDRFKYLMPDGNITHIGGRGAVLLDADGRRHIAGVLFDQTPEKRQARARADNAEEKAHLIRNTLSVISGVVAMTQRTTRSPDEFVPLFSSRLQAIAKSADLVASSSTGFLPLTVFISLLASAASKGRKIKVESCGFGINTDMCQMLAIAIHELMINAVRHGALNGPDGEVIVSFEESGDGDLELIWKESSSEYLQPVDVREGFGLQILTRTLARAFDTDPVIAWDEYGFRYQLVIARDHLVRLGDAI